MLMLLGTFILFLLGGFASLLFTLWKFKQKVKVKTVKKITKVIAVFVGILLVYCYKMSVRIVRFTWKLSKKHVLPKINQVVLKIIVMIKNKNEQKGDNQHAK